MKLPIIVRDKLLNFTCEALGLQEPASLRLSPLRGRGSDREYYRVEIDSGVQGATRAPGMGNRRHSVIVVHYDPKRLENVYYADIGEFLRGIDLPVPQLFRHDPAQCLIVMQDLGSKDLWSFRNAAWKTRKRLYEKTLVVVHRLHTFPEKEFPSNRVALMGGFSLDLYRWEQDYFRDHFVKGFCEIQLEALFGRELERELSALATRLLDTQRSLVHRDLQSQNVMICEGEPFLIDFQGMRFGSPFYDLGSLLCDPYVNFSEQERDQLLYFYYGLAAQALDWLAFRNCFWEASTQRLMQALGAYGFLGLKRGLNAFLRHIPSGLDNLQNAAANLPSLPLLRELLERCRAAIGESE